jgi:four helix bundle protein
MSSYDKLIVWQKSVDLVEAVYRATKTFPDGEKFGLVSQMRRSAVSIPSNIAEGQGRKTRKELRQFLSIAFGSSSELETQFIISYRLEFIGKVEYDSLIALLTEIRKMLNAMIASLSSNN